jgi:hypothetical protein
MHYDHTQYGHLHWLLLLPAAGLLVAVPLVHTPVARILLASAFAATVFTAAMFTWLRVRDEGESLVLAYGPLPVFRKQIRLADITAVETGRTSILDGWGIHWIPGRGWTYNLWGFQCVKLRVGPQTIRIGTDDPQGLAAMLQSRIAADRPATH